MNILEKLTVGLTTLPFLIGSTACSTEAPEPRPTVAVTVTEQAPAPIETAEVDKNSFQLTPEQLRETTDIAVVTALGFIDDVKKSEYFGDPVASGDSLMFLSENSYTRSDGKEVYYSDDVYVAVEQTSEGTKIRLSRRAGLVCNYGAGYEACRPSEKGSRTFIFSSDTPVLVQPGLSEEALRSTLQGPGVVLSEASSSAYPSVEVALDGTVKVIGDTQNANPAEILNNLIRP